MSQTKIAVKLSHCHGLRYLETVRLLQTKTKQSLMLTWRIWIFCPQLSQASFSRARLTHGMPTHTNYCWLRARTVNSLYV